MVRAFFGVHFPAFRSIFFVFVLILVQLLLNKKGYLLQSGLKSKLIDKIFELNEILPRKNRSKMATILGR